MVEGVHLGGGDGVAVMNPPVEKGRRACQDVEKFPSVARVNFVEGGENGRDEYVWIFDLVELRHDGCAFDFVGVGQVLD